MNYFMSEQKPFLSVVVPLYNEEGNVVLLHQRIVEALEKLAKPYEVIFVDDGSKDATVKNATGLTPLTLIEFRKNFGQTAAFDAGFKAAQGDIIVTLDGDLQNDPADIPLLLAKIDEGYDVVSGWRHKRKDPFMKKLSSRMANLVRGILIQDNIHDSGCSLKVYRRECFEGIDLFGEMHRFIPAVLMMDGFRVSEVKVSHHPRIHGVTKYNWKRGLKGIVDMVALWFWRKYSMRPVHLFGGVGMLLFFVGGMILFWMLIEKVYLGQAIGDRLWPMVGIFMLLAGIQLFITGILADMLMREYYHNKGRMNYSIRTIHKS
jgi:glycosyltransferase involved in cell wall biosynthesis